MPNVFGKMWGSDIPLDHGLQARKHLMTHNSEAGHENLKNYIMIHTIHAPIHSNKANMKGWLWWPNDIQGPCRPKAFWNLSYRWGKTPKKPHRGNLSQLGIEPEPTAWQVRMLPPAPHQWTEKYIINTNGKGNRAALTQRTDLNRRAHRCESLRHIAMK